MGERKGGPGRVTVLATAVTTVIAVLAFFGISSFNDLVGSDASSTLATTASTGPPVDHSVQTDPPDTTAPKKPPTTKPPTTKPPTVRFTLFVGIRPQLNQLTESMELHLDGERVAAWSASQWKPTRLLSLEAEAGQHAYELRGEYSYLDVFGTMIQQNVTGAGTVTITDGLALTIVYLNGNTFAVQQAP